MSVLELRVTSARIGEHTHVIALTGELDLYSAERVEHRLADAIEGGAQAVIVDLMGVSFMDSAGLAVLTSAAKALRLAGGKFVVAADDRRILRVFEITGLERSMQIEQSLIEAVDYVVGSRASN